MSTSAPSSPAAAPANRDRRFFGHPLGLFTLFTTEMWERFSFYGMRAILLLFLTAELAEGGLALDDTTGQALVAIYGTGVYLLTIVGGWLADRMIGSRRAVLSGGVVIAAGHVSLALPGAAFTFLGMILVAVGTGLLKSNVSTMVGDLYTRDDPRRQSAFSIFYMGINLGSFFSPLIIMPVRLAFGFHAGFLVAAIGMAFAVAFFVAGRRLLAAEGDVVANPIARDEVPKVLRMIGIILVGVAIVAVIASILQGGWGLGAMIDTLSYVALIAPVVAFVLMYRSPKVTAPERSRLLAYIPLFIAAMLFWMILDQAATTMTTFADQRTDLHIFGLQLGAELFQSINPFVIFVFAPVFAWIWVKTNDRPAVPYKFAIGLSLAAVSFVVLAGGAWLAGDGKAPAILLITVYVIQTIGELFLSPVGLAATTLLAPKAFRGQAMGLWFLAPAAGSAITAQVVQATEGASDVAYFGWTGVIAAVFAVALFAVSPWVRRLIHEADRAEGVHTSGD